MNTVQRIAKNTGVLLFAQIASYILGFFFVMYTARYLGAEGFGINPFRKSVYKTFSFIKNASRKMLRTAIVPKEITYQKKNCFIFGRTEEENTRGLCVFKR